MDDFTIFVKDPNAYMAVIQSMYIVHDVGPPKYYLGNDYFWDKDGNAYIGSSTFVMEAIWKVEQKIGILMCEQLPSPPLDHPELDKQGH